jgi:hypothetical protein
LEFDVFAVEAELIELIGIIFRSATVNVVGVLPADEEFLVRL